MNKKIIVSKAGIGQDTYEWSSTTLDIKAGGTLMIYDRESGNLLHAYSPIRWLEVTLEES